MPPKGVSSAKTRSWLVAKHVQVVLCSWDALQMCAPRSGGKTSCARHRGLAAWQQQVMLSGNYSHQPLVYPVCVCSVLALMYEQPACLHMAVLSQLGVAVSRLYRMVPTYFRCLRLKACMRCCTVEAKLACLAVLPFVASGYLKPWYGSSR